MTKNMKTFIKLLLISIAYLLTFILGATSGIIHPACYAYVGAILPLLTAFVYLYACSVLRSFGAAAVLNGFVLILFSIAGEADICLIIGFLIITALAEIIRYFCGYETLKGVRWSFVPFAFSYFTYVAHWWNDTEGSLAAAVEEMPSGYDQLMIPVIENIPVLIVALLLTIPVAILAMRLAERTLKKPVAALR